MKFYGRDSCLLQIYLLLTAVKKQKINNFKKMYNHVELAG